jgi:hypothetical protein
MSPLRRSCGAASLAASVAVILSASARAQVVAHWINPAGGAFEDGGNWDTGQAPGDHDTAAFSLAGDYSVTIADTADIGGLTIDQGTVSLQIGSALNVGLMTGTPLQIGTGVAASATLRLVSGTLHTDLSSTHIGNPAGTTGAFIIESGAEFWDSNGWVYIGGPGTGQLIVRGTWTDTGADKEKYLAAGSTIHVDPTGSLNLRHLNNLGGRIEVDAGRMNSATWMGQGDIIASNGAVLTTQDIFSHDAGAVTILSGSTLDALPCYEMSGDVLVDGPGSQITGELAGSPTTLTVRNGGAVRAQFEIDLQGAPTVYVGHDSTLQVGTEFNLRGGLLHVEQGATLALGNLMLSGTPTLEFALDGSNLLGSSLLTCGPLMPGFAGTVRAIMAHPNNIHVGDQIELVHWSNTAPFVTSFSALDYQPLGGGRLLLLVYASPSVFIRVVPGGPPCWTADFNGDGAVGTDADIEAFFACIAGNCCATCGSADFDGNGSPGTDADIETFFRVLAGGPC